MPAFARRPEGSTALVPGRGVLLPTAPAQTTDAVAAALAGARRRLVSVAAFSGAINLLTLSGSIYMLQVYDRVLPSRNFATLIGCR